MLTTRYPVQLDVEVSDIKGIGLDEVSSRLDFFAHQDVEDLIGRIEILDTDLQQAPRLGIHGGLPELLRIHLAEAFVPLDAETLFGNLVYAPHNFIDRDDRFPLAFMDQG